MKINCPFCKATKVPEAGIWDFFACGTDVDKNGKHRQSMQCLSIQRDRLLEKVIELEEKIQDLYIKYEKNNRPNSICRHSNVGCLSRS
jgi:hypothetical protein